MSTPPEQRQLAIDLMTEALISDGMDEEDAEIFATHCTDEAIAQQES